MFRNGNANLHYRHVNKKKGRTCSICHSSHATKGPLLVKDSFKFGNRILEINFEKTEEGGKCETTCHRLGKYNRYKPEENLLRTTPFPGKQATEEELEQSRINDLRRLQEKRKKMEGELKGGENR
jgi:predicted CXXCH cytochrome family protein